MINIIEPRVTYLPVDYTHPQPAQYQIERATRVCYKSFDKMTEDSYERFYNMLRNTSDSRSGDHMIPFEHGTYYINILEMSKENGFSDAYTIIGSQIEHVYESKNREWVVINGRTYEMIKEKCPNIDKYVTQILPPELADDRNAKRLTFEIVLSRDIADEFKCHRLLSPLMESSRYVNYIKGMNVIIPDAYKDNLTAKEYLLRAYDNALKSYNELISIGMKPQFARNVLPLGYTTKLIITGFIPDLEEFCRRRMAVKAHPEARKVAKMINDILITIC